MEQQDLIEKIKRLPPNQVAEVQEFVNSLARGKSLTNREKLHQALVEYATQYAGTPADIDEDLEATATAHLLEHDSEP